MIKVGPDNKVWVNINIENPYRDILLNANRELNSRLDGIDYTVFIDKDKAVNRFSIAAYDKDYKLILKKSVLQHSYETLLSRVHTIFEKIIQASKNKF